MSDLPRVLQYNKRDVQHPMPVEIMRQELNPSGLPDFEATATKGTGVLETIESLARQMTQRLEHTAKLDS